MWNNAKKTEKMDIEDRDDSYLCLNCNHEGLESTFGVRIQCPGCGSDDIVCAEFWKRFKKIEHGE